MAYGCKRALRSPQGRTLDGTKVKKKGVGYYETEGMCDFSNQSGRFQVVPEYGITNYKWVMNRRLQRCNVKDQKTYHYK